MSSGAGRRALRVALYSHDAQGLGHVRRNLAIASAISSLDPAPEVLVVSGAAEAAGLPRPPRCDVVTLPGLAKDEDGGYAARYLSVPAADLVSVRSAIATAALTSYAPDLLVVDRHPRGVFGELETALARLHAGGTRIVLGLRDVLDDHPTASREWAGTGSAAALRRWYDAVWVYGDPAVHDLVDELGIRAAGLPVHYTGYLAPPGRPAGTGRAHAIVGLVGGGHDGGAVARAFAAAALPGGWSGILVTGPRMADREHAAVVTLARRNPGLRVMRHVPGCDHLLDRAAAVVTMGGYNTLCEVLGRGLPVLVVPRVRPRREQLVRAEALERRGLVDLLRPEALSPDAVSAWTASAVHRGRNPVTGVDLGGLARLPDLVRSLRPWSQHAEQVCRAG